MIAANEVKLKMNKAGRAKTPFLFGIDYRMEKGFFIPNPMNNKDTLLWKVGNSSNINEEKSFNSGSYFRANPISFEEYSRRFDIIQKGLKHGDSFLANLTLTTEVEMDYSFEELLTKSQSPYAVLLKDRFVCFSPETFIKIKNGIISSNPMKGTISGEIPNAKATILNDYKESAEHFTIVDFIRSDLSRVSTNVKVEKLRYIDCLETSKGKILQVSSKITGELPDNYLDFLGDIMFELLPAGSISGAPKPATLKLIEDAEPDNRNYYSGVFGYFDGKDLDSAVMIRFIEKEDDKYYFHSGGGITINSNCKDEYEEVLEKIYLPFV